MPVSLWEQYIMALEEVSKRLQRVAAAFRTANIEYALVGGQAVALWVATKDPSAVRTTKDINILLRREDLGAARAAAGSIDLDYFETMGVGMFLERENPNPRHAVHVVWANELIRPGHELPAPALDDTEVLASNFPVVSLAGLVRMKIQANRDQDRVHIPDMIDVGLVTRDQLAGLPPTLAPRLDELLREAGL
jgi:hypothetical protein